MGLSRSGLALTFAAAMLAQVPAADSRNVNRPDTDTRFTHFDVPSLVEWEARKVELRNQILFAAGLSPLPERTPLHPHVFGRLERKDYTIEKVYLETLPGYFLGGNLFRPRGARGRSPGILVAHGHWQYGRLENQPLFSGPTLGASLARQGYVAFAWDMVGYNDTLQTPHAFGSRREQLWGFGPLGLQLWNSMRALDFLQGLPDVDPERIAMTGASGGGTQTFLLTAVDDRVKFSAPANMVSAEMQGGDICENAPGLRLGTFNVEIAAMTAPRPLLLVSTSGDWTHNVPNFEYPAIRRVYELYGKAGDVQNAHFVFPEHNFNRASRTAVYSFLASYLNPAGAAAATEPDDEEEDAPKLQDMLVFEGRALPEGAKSYDEIFAFWRQMAQHSIEKLSGPELRDRLRRALAVKMPEKVIAAEQGGRLVLSRAGEGDRVPVLWFPGQGSPALVVDPDGADAVAGQERVKALRAGGAPVLAIDAFQTGAARAARPAEPRYYLTFNRSDDQNRVQDILTAAAYLKTKVPGAPVRVVGIGRAAVWCLFAAAAAGGGLQFDAMPERFHGADEDFLRDFFVPGVQRIGGLRTAVALAAPAREIP
jgi:dienelactone hydrolase